MKPKLRKELRERFINPLYAFMQENKERFDSTETFFLNNALGLLINADIHQFHVESTKKKVAEVIDNDELPF